MEIKMVERQKDNAKLMKIGQLLLEKRKLLGKIILQEKNLYIIEAKNCLAVKIGYQFDI